jgi:hypothetical protein
MHTEAPKCACLRFAKFATTLLSCVLVVHAAGGYTAWSDKHPSYSSVSSPGQGTNLDDYYSPEINSIPVAR